MTFLADLTEKLRAVAGRAELDVAPGELLGALRGMDDDAVVALVEQAAAIGACADRLKVVGAAVITERSTAAGGGLARSRGFRTPVQLVQDITGGTRGDASRTVRVGTSLLDEEVDAGAPATPDAGPAKADEPDEARVIWHDELRDAMLSGSLTTAQHDAIRRGLGDPPEVTGGSEVWAIAARQLMDECARMTVEDLRKRACAMRDALDPAGAEERFAERFAKRSWRTWTDEHGQRHSHIVHDDEGGAWLDDLIGAALRPRRGGPRFMTDAERAEAEALSDDPRSNEQLTYDLMMSVIRAGSLASAADVYGARRPGVRMVAVKDLVGPRDLFGRLMATTYLEDGGEALPGSVLDATLCEVGHVEVTVSACGNPLDVGRSQRLFTPAQKLALAVRDGGCMWPGCSARASYCESHHIIPWSQGGTTDTDHGILLCRFHHLLLHNEGWRITRSPDKGDFILHSPTGTQTRLRSKSAVRWAWDPPPDTPGWRTPPTPDPPDAPFADVAEARQSLLSDAGVGPMQASGRPRGDDPHVREGSEDLQDDVEARRQVTAPKSVQLPVEAHR